MARSEHKAEFIKDIWESPSLGDNASHKGAHHGYSISDPTHECYIEFYIPQDFESAVELKVVIISQALMDHGMAVTTMYASRGEYYQANSENKHYPIPWARRNMIYEVDISDLIDAGPIQGGDYLGIVVAGGPGGSNYLVIGARLKYKRKAVVY